MAEGERELYDVAARIARGLLARRDWRLVTGAELPALAAAVARDAQAQQANSRLPLAALIERLTVTHYCRRWYAACRGPAGERQQRAWVELHRHISATASYFVDRTELDDAAQSVLIRIYERLETLREPGAFLRWADQVTRNWCLDHYRRAGPATAALEDEAGGPPETQAPAAGSERIEALLRRCLRSQAQRQVIVGRLVHNRKVEDLAEELGTTPGNIRVLTHRALERLRTCGDLQDQLRAYRARRAADQDDPNRTLRETRLPALTCAECQAVLPAYAARVLSGHDARRTYPAVTRHLEGCGECALALADLLEMAEAEDAAAGTARAPDLSFLGSGSP